MSNGVGFLLVREITAPGHFYTVVGVVVRHFCGSDLVPVAQRGTEAARTV